MTTDELRRLLADLAEEFRGLLDEVDWSRKRIVQLEAALLRAGVTVPPAT